jgi:ribonucleoside-triphosphate reductase (formate)
MIEYIKTFENIKKRNGEIVKFDSSNITAAIAKAGNATSEFDEKKAKKLTLQVLTLAHELHPDSISVEEIQDIVEKVLLNTPYYKTAKAYILYREQHAQLRNIASIESIDLVDSYIKKLDWKIRENSNMCYSLQGLNNYISSYITSEYWLNKIYPPEVRDAHKKGDLHIHDLSLLSVYCVGWDLYDLLKQGFRGVSGKIESAPPKHFRTALGQIVNFFYTLQGEAAGAQAFSSFDTLLAPFIKNDNLKYKEIKQALQEFVFNINIPTRVGFQTPFTNITMDLTVHETLKNQSVIIGGTEQDSTYSEYQPEMDLLNKAFAEVMIEGDAKERIFTFPIPTYNITKDFDWDNPKLDSIWEMTSKYGIPYFSNFINSDMSPEDARSMCCRLRLDNRELIKGGGLFGANPLTGSIGVVTVNMPRIGFLAKDEKNFFEILEKNLLLAKTSLVIKRKVLEMFTEKNLYPYSKHYLQDIKKRAGYYWKNHFSTIGVIGMNEACLNFIGKDIASKEGMEFALKTMDFLLNKLSEFKQDTGEIFNLEATPAEGTTYRLAKMDKEEFPEIICANEKEMKNNNAAPYYTNSSHLPVNYSDDLFEALELQDELQIKYTGGTVFHVFLGESIEDIKSVKKIIKKVANNFKLPYFTITPTFSVCPSHGYIKGEQPKCSLCGAETEVYSRVVGYLRPIAQWNDGKQSEFIKRKTYQDAE